MEKEAFEPTGLIPRSIIRTVDRFVQQLLPGREKIALQEYRVSRYQILVSIKSLTTLISVPLLLNFTVKALLFTPLIEHFWNSHQAEIFLNSYQEKRAFSEMHDFSEKMFFESLLIDSKSRWLPKESLHVTDPKVFLSTSNEQKYQNFPLVQIQTQHASKAFSTKYKSSICEPCALQIVDKYSTDTAPRACRAQNVRQEIESKESKVNGKPLLCHARNGRSEASNFRVAKASSCDLLCSEGAKQSKGIKSTAKSVNKKKDLLDEKQGKNENEAFALSSIVSFDNDRYRALFQIKSLELAKSYNKQSILAITNLLGDFLSFFILSLLFRIMRPELIILKSFLTESVYSLSDTTKSFLLILGMDLLVGFHSPRGWELALEGFLRHIGLPENENFILLFVALFPVFLDTVFKYWIFRYLNKISPSTVVTYHSMIE